MNSTELLCMRSHSIRALQRPHLAVISCLLAMLSIVWSCLIPNVYAQSEDAFLQQETGKVKAGDVRPVTPPPPIPVLNYHSITVDPGNRATITPEKFEAQMIYLSENGFTPLSLQQFTDILEGNESAPDKPVLLTFDDGYADNYEHALPLLKKLGFHATLFMSPGMVDDGYFLNWEQIKEMHEAGWDIQPHGMTHPHLPLLKKDKQEYELMEARRQIEEQLGTIADVYCYPYGEWNQTTIKILKENEFRYAFTIEQGMTTSKQDPLKLKRIFVNGEESIEKWKGRLAPN